MANKIGECKNSIQFFMVMCITRDITNLPCRGFIELEGGYN